ncbi:hypothetical protein PYW08_003924 [Mythimna loreyi]|uniref:Uncharacterized protein n=1 Tax=Mythimna loreyi TaxID=667449 RepID=A0ACC2QUJ7_9NEOP|nr:hypothetical protein PYW08_003924 [Mythimna loreyi]
MNTKTLLFFFIVNFASHSYGQKSKKFFRNDYTYMDELKSFYKIHTVPQTWADAKRVCALEQATFWHPDNDDEANALLSFWNRTKPNIEWMYVALSDLFVEGVFETIDGKPVSEKTLQSLEWNYQCDMPNLDYTFNNKNGKCYKLHTTPLNWNEAKAVCQLEQSSLAKVHNQLDADYLAKLTKSTPIPRVKAKYQRGIYHLGFYNRLNEGWRTVGGKPMIVDLDTWFDNYQPEAENRDQCGAMFFNGRLININCDMRSFFICEHELEDVILPAYTAQPLLQPFVGGGVDS